MLKAHDTVSQERERVREGVAQEGLTTLASSKASIITRVNVRYLQARQSLGFAEESPGHQFCSPTQQILAQSFRKESIMRKVAVLLFAIAVPALCSAQTTRNPQSPDDVKVVGAVWRPGVTWPRDLGSRTWNNISRPDGQTTRVTSDPNDQRDQNELTRMNRNGQLGPLPDTPFLLSGRGEAIVGIRNDGAKAVKAIRYNFLLVNKDNGKELLRYRFHSKLAIGPGETRTLRNGVVDQRAQGFTPSEIGSKISGSGQVETRVEITRIEYADGSVWRRP